MIVKIQQKLRRTVVAAAVQVVEDDHKLFTAPLAALKNLTRTKTNAMLLCSLTRAFLTLSKIIREKKLPVEEIYIEWGKLDNICRQITEPKEAVNA